MINVYIFSQKQFKAVMKDMGWNDNTIDLIQDSAIISICNTVTNIVDSSMSHWFEKNHSNVLNIDFDDTTFDNDELGIHSISERQASQIVDFFEKNIDKKHLIVHCEAGISRSSATALCWIDFLRMNNIRDITLHQIQSICPNPKVERLIHSEFSKRNTDII